MIKNFEEFLGKSKSLNENKYESDYDYLEQHVNLVQECVSYCINVVKENGGRVELNRPMWMAFFPKYDRMFKNLLVDKVVAFELGNQDDEKIFDDMCGEGIVYRDKDGDFLVAILNGSEDRWVVDHWTCPDDFIFEMFSNIEYSRK